MVHHICTWESKCSGAGASLLCGSAGGFSANSRRHRWFTMPVPNASPSTFTDVRNRSLHSCWLVLKLRSIIVSNTYSYTCCKVCTLFDLLFTNGVGTRLIIVVTRPHTEASRRQWWARCRQWGGRRRSARWASWRGPRSEWPPRRCSPAWPSGSRWSLARRWAGCCSSTARHSTASSNSLKALRTTWAM